MAHDISHLYTSIDQSHTFVLCEKNGDLRKRMCFSSPLPSIILGSIKIDITGNERETDLL